MWIITHKLCFYMTWLFLFSTPTIPTLIAEFLTLYWVNVSRTLYNVISFLYMYFTALIVWRSHNFSSCMDSLKPHQLSDSFHFSQIIFLREKIANPVQSYFGRNLSNFQQLNGLWTDFFMLDLRLVQSVWVSRGKHTASLWREVFWRLWR